MKHLLILLLALTGACARGQYVTAKTFNSITTILNNTNTAQDAIIKKLVADTAAKAIRLAAQDKTIALLQDQRKTYTADSAATQKKLSDLAAAKLIMDSNMANINKNFTNMAAQNRDFYLRTDSLNKKLKDITIQSTDLQRQINDVSDVAVKAVIEANKRDSITGKPGEITLEQMPAGTWVLGVYNYAQLAQRVTNLEAKKP